MAASTMTTCESVRTGSHRKEEVDQNWRPGTIDETVQADRPEETYCLSRRNRSFSNFALMDRHLQALRTGRRNSQ
jgi:hypothetical protein